MVMKKLNKVIYNKLMLQADEAQYLGMNKLAQTIADAVKDGPREDDMEYSSSEISQDVHAKLWSAALDVLKYHDLESVDASKLDAEVKRLAEEFMSRIESLLDVSDSNSKLEPKVPGQD
jgi:hypothetical protein